METQRLGTSNMEISRVGIGTAPIGSTPEWRIYWGSQDEKTAISAIQTALDIGVNWIDTAPFYGWGRAERIVGKAIKGRRDEVFIFTKCGTLQDGKGGWLESLKPESIGRELESSLSNLETDYVDLYQFHDPDPSTPIEESWSEVQRLIDEGKVRYGGLSNHPVELIDRASKVGPVTSTQNQYSLLERGIEKDVLPFCRQRNIGVLGWSPLASGFLTDEFDIETLDKEDFRRRHRFAQRENYANIRQIRDKLGPVIRMHNRSLVELAIAWDLMHPGLTGAIIGVRSEKEAREMTKAVGWKLTHEEMAYIEKTIGTWQG